MANETITGKIFTLKDPTGTYNRFPRTVMEAVYGLIPYLQNQFGALADIYMPIEGITESKPLQEFVYRLCPSTIKAKSLTLDRIYGKTLAWNQLIQTVSKTLSPGDSHVEIITFDIIANHKYYLYIKASRVSTESDKYQAYLTGVITSYNILAGGTIYEQTISTTSSGRQQLYLQAYSTLQSDVSFTFQLVDLSLLDPDILSTTMEGTIANYKRIFPAIYPYSAGKLISNDAESIETVGFNQWDEEWEVGGIDQNGRPISTSQVIRSKNFIGVLGGNDYNFHCPNGTWYHWYDANKNHISGNIQTTLNFVLTSPSNAAYLKIQPAAAYGATYNHDICINLSDPAKNGTYEPYRESTMQLGLGSFQVRDSQGNVTTITGGLKSAGSVYDEIVGNKYVKRVGEVDLGSFVWRKHSSGNRYTTTTNLSNFVASNGSNTICAKYTPHISSNIYGDTTDKYIVVDGNGMVVVHDESYTDAASFNSSAAGVMLNYALATPIEYELVSPLVPTVKAGETEARISPNSDGLSAPMVADMTYDAQANNDSASAQYALTAGRLLNSHKLWGQDFDGTQDVTGALTGVTSITMNGALSGVTTLSASGAVTLGSTLSVTGNTTVGGTLGVTGAATLGSTLTVTGLTSIAGGLKLTTTKKIWFDDTHYLELLTENGTQYLHTNLNVVSDAGVVAGASANS